MESTHAHSKRRLAFDMDGVLADFYGGFLKKYNETHHDDQKLSVKSWNLDECGLKYPHKDIWANHDFFKNLEVIPGMKTLFLEAKKQYEVFIITASPPTCHQAKVNWVKEKIDPEFNDWNIIFTNRKDVIDVDILVDDAIHNMTKNNAILFVGEHNKVAAKQVSGIKKIYSVEELRKELL